MFFNTITSDIAIIIKKMSYVDEEQAVLEWVTLSDFKRWSSTTFKTFDNYTIVKNNNTDNISRS